MTSGEVEWKLNQLRQEVADAILSYHNEIMHPYIDSVIKATRPYRPVWLRVYQYFQLLFYRRRVEKRMKKYRPFVEKGEG